MARGSMERWVSLTARSAGPRICVGYALAQLELVALLHAVLRRYELFPAGPGYPEPREHVLVTNGPRESGLFLKLVPR